MVLFLVAVAGLAALLGRPLVNAFMGNPAVNGVILGILIAGIVYIFRQVLSLDPELRWIEDFRNHESGGGDSAADQAAPRLLGSMARMLEAQQGRRVSLSATSLQALLDGIASRLNETRETSRYLIGVLIFLGLLGTFYGLLETVRSVGDVLGALNIGANDVARAFADLKSGLESPLHGMSTAFSASLFGLAGSLVLGFLDLQAGQAQNRFYSEFEEFLASHVQTTPVVEAIPEAPIIAQGAQPAIEYQRDAKAIATLAEGIQALVGHMRTEQQQIRDWVDAQAAQQEDVGKLLRRLLDELGAR